jgi:hypothetical protein
MASKPDRNIQLSMSFSPKRRRRFSPSVEASAVVAKNLCLSIFTCLSMDAYCSGT